MAKHTVEELQMLQALPLEVKVRKTEQRIKEWVEEYGIDGVYVSFSGGKDSTVLLNIARRLFPAIKAVFVDTGLEYPEIRAFVRTFDNVDWLKPKMNFKQVIEKYGYPFISKEVSNTVYGAKNNIKEKKYSHRLYKLGVDKNEYGGLRDDGKYDYAKALDGSLFMQKKWRFLLDAEFDVASMCCNVMKKTPVHAYTKQTGRMPITAQMASESQNRTVQWLKNGCNGFDMKLPISNPMSFWTEQDVLYYIFKYIEPQFTEAWFGTRYYHGTRRRKAIKFLKKNGYRRDAIASVYGEIIRDYDGTDNVEGQLDFSKLDASLGVFDIGKPTLKTTGCSRTGCMFCGYGCHLEKSPNRFERMKETHPKQYDYIMRPKEEGGLNYKAVIDWINENGNMNIKY